jgi:hypothetical protein
MDWTELIAWIGWAVTVGAWAWQASRPAPPPPVSPVLQVIDLPESRPAVVPDPSPVAAPPSPAPRVDGGRAFPSRHRLDTWTAALHAPDGRIVALRHGRGTIPAALRYPLRKSLAARTFTYRAADEDEPSLHHFDQV